MQTHTILYAIIDVVLLVLFYSSYIGSVSGLFQLPTSREGRFVKVTGALVSMVLVYLSTMMANMFFTRSLVHGPTWVVCAILLGTAIVLRARTPLGGWSGVLATLTVLVLTLIAL